MPEFPGQYGGGGYVQVYGNTPATTSGTTLTANASADTKGSYVQLTAATTHDANWIVVNLGASANQASFLVDIAIGSATEQIILPDLLVWTRLGDSGQTYLFPIFIPAGSRLAARCQSSTGGGAIQITVNLVSGTMLGGGVGPSWADAYGAVAASTGTNVDPGGTASTDSSWVEIASATTRPHNWLVFAAKFGDGTLAAAAKWLVDIGIGSATEQEIVSDIFVSAGITTDMACGGWVQHFPIFIPEGSRLTCRARCSVTTDGDRDLNVKLYGC